MKKFSLIFLFIFFACSTRTLYNIDIDLISFLDEADLEQSIVFPASLDLSIFLFPEAEISSDGPGQLSQKGIIINFPPQDIIDLNNISVKLEFEAEIINNSLTDQITGDRVSLFIALPEKENIYTEGIRIDLINIETILPLESSVFVQEIYLNDDDALMEIFRTGEFRMGVGIYLTSSAEFLPADYRLNRIHLSTSFTSLDLLRVSE